MTTQAQRRDPLVPDDVRLKDLPAFLCDIDLLVNSRWSAMATDAEWRAGLMLYGNCFRQVPAGSLPDDDRHLAFLAGYGRDIEGFRVVRERALDGWELSSDGRFYRADVALKVLAVWVERMLKRRAFTLAAQRRAGTKDGRDVLAEEAIARAVVAIRALDPMHPLLRTLSGRMTSRRQEGATS